MIKIGFLINFNTLKWLGGTYVIKNLIHCINTFSKKEILNKKIKIGTFYKKIKSKNFRMTQAAVKNTKPVYWLNSIYFENLNKFRVRKIGERLMKYGIEIRSGFWPLSDLKKFSSKYVGKEKVSRNIFEKTLALPSNFLLSNKDIKLIIKKVEYLINKIK